MAFSVVASTKYTPTTSSTTRTVTVPTGVADGDTILVAVSAGGGSTVLTTSGLSGLTSVDMKQVSGLTAQVYVKANALASDAGTVITVTSSVAIRGTVGLVVMRGLSLSNVVDAYANGSAISTTSHVTGTATAASDGDIKVAIIGTSQNNSLTSWTAPAGFTKDVESYDPTTAGATSLVIGHATAPVAVGATGGGDTWTSDVSANSISWTLLFKVPTASNVVRPNTLDSNAGGWSAVGAATIPAALADESDTSYAESGDNPTSATFQCAYDIPASGLVKVSNRAGLTGGTGSLTATLKQGTTTIASWTDTLTTTPADYVHTTTSGEAATITDYSNLHVLVSATAS